MKELAISYFSRMLQTVKIFSLAMALTTGAVSAHAAEIQVYAAPSLTDALTEIGQNYEKSSGDKVLFNFAASSLLARQIQEGAPADLFISADEEKMDGLEKKNLVVKETRMSLLSNTLVLVAEKDSALFLRSPKELADAKIKKIEAKEKGALKENISNRSESGPKSSTGSFSPKTSAQPWLRWSMEMWTLALSIRRMLLFPRRSKLFMKFL